MAKPFETEADLVVAFCEAVERRNANKNSPQEWVIYHETGGWDVLLADKLTGIQVGVEAKLSLNPKVVEQALPSGSYWNMTGPDYRAVLVPREGLQNHMAHIVGFLGVTVIRMDEQYAGYNKTEWNFSPHTLPREDNVYSSDGWFPWLPEQRVVLPDYIPDVMGGKASPVTLTQWKIKAIKLMVVLARRGHVTRHDMKLLQISPSRWTAGPRPFLFPDTIKGGYIAHDWTPDLRAQHPVNFAQIEADFETWGKGFDLTP